MRNGGKRFRALSEAFSQLCLEQLEQRVLLAADLISHWRAEDLVASLEDGMSAPAWNDRIATTPALQEGTPRLAHGILGGRASMQFDASDGPDGYEVAYLENKLNGANDFSIAVVFATSSTQLVGDGTGNWFQGTGLVDANTLGFGRDWGIAISGNGRISAGMGNGFGHPPTTVHSEQTGLNDGDLHTVVLTRSGSTISLFIDGEASGSTAEVHGQPLADLAFTIGMLQTNQNPFSGDIPEVQFYGDDLSAAEIVDFHNEMLSFYQNSPPIAVADHYTLDEDASIFMVTAADGVLKNDSDTESDPLTAELVTGTQHGEIGLLPNGALIYNPYNDFFGNDFFIYIARDSQASEPVTVTFEVRPTYDPATAINDTYQGLPNEPLVIPALTGVLANDNNPDQTPLAARISREASQGSVTLRDDGSFIYDAQGFVGNATFEYQIDDGTRLSNAASVNILVNTPPTTQADHFTVTEDQPLVVIAANGILQNDFDADGEQLTVVLAEGPAAGVLELQTDGSFHYLPASNFFGSDRFSYIVNDGVLSSEATEVGLKIEAVNDQPVSIADQYFAVADSLLTVAATEGLLANDSDIDDEFLKVVQVTEPANGQLKLNDDGSFSYTPNPGYLGLDTFQYLASDGRLESNIVDVTFNVSDRPVVISEFMAMNASTLQTRTRRTLAETYFGDQESPDWIEIKNEISAPVDISGMFLTDDPDQLTKWEIPAGTTIPGDGFLIIFASSRDIRDPGLDETGRLHANFSLDSDGDYLAITTGSKGIIDEVTTETFGQQATDVSFGTIKGQQRYFDDPTPGQANRGGLLDIVADTRFSVGRGYFDESFEVIVSTTTPGATLVYTIDGKEPTLEEGNRVESTDSETPPTVTLSIDKTTTLRAAAFKTNHVPTNIDTQTYFFIENILSQSNLWSRITDDDQWGPMLKDSLLSIPTISLVSEGRITQRESAVSVEMIYPDGTEGFQIDAGIEQYGGHSLNSPKKNMRLSFKSIYGDSKLNYDMFGDDAVNEFNQLLLRSGSHDNWFWTHPAGGKGNYTRNRWTFDRQLEMGHLAPHGRYVQVYINGEYWGLHHLMERPNAAFMASYLGGEEKDYDALNAGSPIDGDNVAWRALQSSEVIDDYERVQEFLDVENYADYMLLQFYAGNDWDWNHSQNWAAARPRLNGDGFIFFGWDSDLVLRTTANANVITRGGPGNLWNARGGMKQHDEFLMLMADRAHRLFFNNGMLTSDRLREDIEALADEVRLPVIAETAIWGRRGHSGPYTPAVWESSIEWMLNRFAPETGTDRTATVISQLRKAGVYPSIDAPEFSVNGQSQHGGDIGSDDRITITAEEGIVYYTTDGSDPRLAGGALNPEARVFTDQPLTLPANTVLKTRLLDAEQWSALSEAAFRVDTVPASPDNLRISEIHYHPADPSEAELAAGYADADQFEFIELVNIGNQAIDLNSVHLRRVEREGNNQGVEFSFAKLDQPALAAGERLVVVEDQDAFRTRYGSEPWVAGAWSGGLSNRQEQILLTVGDQTIHQFTYLDNWFPETDGNGRSLVATDLAANLESWHSSAGWRPSRLVGGSPGAPSDLVDLPGDANRDGKFNSSDLVQVFAAGKFEDGTPNNSTWEEGDWDGDGDFTSSDIVIAFQAGHYSAAAKANVSPTVNDLRIGNQLLQRTDQEKTKTPQIDFAASLDRKPQQILLEARDQIFENWNETKPIVPADKNDGVEFLPA
ncbi:MAG: tandem-95 repeat protein [Planctomycetaceae bacterium]|nr:tandem-95 repeat protein [Planctomycetaceae bacterium]